MTTFWNWKLQEICWDSLKKICISLNQKTQQEIFSMDMTPNFFCILVGYETTRCISFLGEGDFPPFKHPKLIWVPLTLHRWWEAKPVIWGTCFGNNPRKTCFLGHTFFFLTLGIAGKMRRRKKWNQAYSDNFNGGQGDGEPMPGIPICKKITQKTHPRNVFFTKMQQDSSSGMSFATLLHVTEK